MQIEWSENLPINETNLSCASQHILIVCIDTLPEVFPFSELLDRKLSRLGQSRAMLREKPVSLETVAGNLVSLVYLATTYSAFERLTRLRLAVNLLLEEHPSHISIAVLGDAEIASLIKEIIWVLGVNTQNLMNYKRATQPQALEHLTLMGIPEIGLADILADVAGNSLCRELTLTPPNKLTPEGYVERIRILSNQYRWRHEVMNIEQLEKMGAGAFLAVARGADRQDAAIVRLSYRHPHAHRKLALVGKGICFDTGGHNLKSSKYMLGMHQDMNGSAVALGIMQSVTMQNLVVNVDCWLAIAENHIGPNAYKQNEVVTALNGKTIEVIHTDAEGRMVLADTLTLASREQPDVMLDFATLTGSMQAALGTRMSGIITNRSWLTRDMLAAGDQSGERLVAFPCPSDFDHALESDIADIKQCTLESDADHILAARFLSQFIEGEIPWCHMDLSSYAHKDGLGAVSSEVNGFGVHLTMDWLRAWLAQH